MAGRHDTAWYALWCCAYGSRSNCTIATPESTAALCASTEQSVNLLFLTSGDPSLPAFDCFFHNFDAVNGASLIAEEAEPASALEPFAVFVPDWIACTA